MYVLPMIALSVFAIERYDTDRGTLHVGIGVFTMVIMFAIAAAVASFFVWYVAERSMTRIRALPDVPDSMVVATPGYGDSATVMLRNLSVQAIPVIVYAECRDGQTMFANAVELMPGSDVELGLNRISKIPNGARKPYPAFHVKRLPQDFDYNYNGGNLFLAVAMYRGDMNDDSDGVVDL